DVTYDDINEALPENMADPEEMEQLINRLRSMEVDIIDASEVDRYKDGKKDIDDEEEEKDQKLDILDDPVRMYLKQMGQVPLLTREQEVEISKRIEDAELMVQKFINRFGFTSKSHLDLAQKLIEGRERFDRVILDKKIESRERYMKGLPKLCSQIERSSSEVAALYRNLVEARDARRASTLKSVLMKAVEKFEYRRGYKFSTYATWWIRQAITRSIADQARTIRIPVHMIETINKLMRVQKQLVQEYGREPTPEEVAEEILLPVDRVRAVLKMAQQPISLQSPVGESEETNFGDFIEDKGAENPSDMTAIVLLKEKIKDVL